ncbi:MAG: DMT family transporter [Candidatus Vecturithrix sp.]|jgi:drug/metabolite transporter (DMT)-like permease|nr:DMT family transporter [Candidatus Vecturithrix sp.]
MSKYHQHDEKIQGLGLAVVAGVIFGTSGILTRAITDISPIGIATGRLIVGFLFMMVLIWAQEQGIALKHSLRHYPLLLALGLISSLHFVLFVRAIQKTFIANALILVNTAPILVLVLAPFFLKEAISLVDILGVAITFIGAGLIVGMDKVLLTPDHLTGDLCALGSALCYALYVILARKLRKTYSSQVIMFWFFGLGALFLLLGGIGLRDPFFQTPTLTSWIFLGLLGIFPTGVGHFAYNLSLKYLAAAKASTIILLEPVTGTLCALVFWGEVPPFSTWVGIVIALGGITLASFTQNSLSLTRKREYV